jgi:L-malate glycosyltransferase
VRIAQLISSGTANGAARYCLALTRRLVARGHDVLLIHRPWFEDTPIDVPGARLEQSQFVLPETFRVLRMLRGFGAEVIHTHMSGAGGFGGLLKLAGGPPMVATSHARHFQPHWLLNDLVIAPSERTARYQRDINRVPASKIEVIPTFLGGQIFAPPTEAQRAAARAALGVSPETVLIGQVGDIHFDKRQSDLVLAARRLIDAGLDVKVALKGAPVDRVEGRRLERAMEGAQDRVALLPRDRHVEAFLHGLDVFCVSSGREEGPLVALEAMSTGLPVVSTRVGRMDELSAGGTAALLVAPRDVAAMAEALRRLAEAPALRAEMGAAALTRAVAEHDAEAAVDRIEAALIRVGTGRGALGR